MGKAIQRIGDASQEFISRRPHNVKIFKAYGAESNKPFVDKAANRLTNHLHRIPIKDYNVSSGRGWPTVTCHTGPEVFALPVYGERSSI